MMLEKQIGWQFDNTYSKLPESIVSKVNPTPVKKPNLIIFNHALSEKIGLNFSKIKNNELASMFSGNQLPEGSETIAQAYAGHQFGHFTILGDGRALMIGEHLTDNKERYDIQFKGSGKTPYSRNADGRAALGPMLREYIISEAMSSLGIPTTRSLAVVETGENVIREEVLKGAILTRVASSHIRVGTFQFALVSRNKNDLKDLFDYTVNRHYPHIKNSESPALDLLEIVLKKQINLVCDWMRVGFIHGVMNTDNMTVSGETIDYGPCAFMDNYDPNTVFSSIDRYGRYAYYNQPRIAKWNLERFAESLIPLINIESKKAVKAATNILSKYEDMYKKSWFEMMKKKLGLKNDDAEDESLIIELLSWMQKNKADYTNTFCYLMNMLQKEEEVYKDQEFIHWGKKWKNRCDKYGSSLEKSFKVMRSVNPLVIPRNHLVEEALNDANENDFKKTQELLKILLDPYNDKNKISHYQSSPIQTKKKYKTFCGT